MQHIFVMLLILNCLVPCIAFYASPVKYIQRKSSDSIVPLQEAAEILYVPSPDNWSAYLYSTITTNGSSNAAQVNTSTVENTMTNWPIPNSFRDSVVKHVRLLVMTASNGFSVAQAFLFNETNSASLSTLLTVARKIDSTLDSDSSVLIQYFAIHSYGTAKQLYTNFETRTCERCINCIWLSSCCCRWVTNSRPRGNTASEMYLIKTKLLAEQYAWLNQHISQRTPSVVLLDNFHPDTRSGDGLIDVVERYLADDQAAAEIIADYDDPILSGLQANVPLLKQSSRVMKLTKLSRKNLQLLLTALADEYGFNASFTNSHYQRLLKAAHSSYENLFSTPTKDDTSDMVIKYVWILIENHNNMTYSLYFLNLDITLQSLLDTAPSNNTNSVKIAGKQTSLEMIRISALSHDGHFTDEHLLQSVAAWPLETTRIVLNIFRFIGASTLAPKPYRMLSYFQSKVLPTPLGRAEGTSTTPASVVDKFQSLLKTVSSALTTVKDVITTLKSSRSSTIERIVRTGFRHFQQKSQVLKVMDIPKKHVKEFINTMIIDFDLPSRGTISFSLTYSPDTIWEEISYLYSPSMNGTYRSLTIYKNGDKNTNTASFLIVDINAAWQMAPDLLMITDRRSYIGGLWESSSQSIQEVPHVLTLQEANQLQQFFMLIALNNVGTALGLNTTLPEF